MKTFTSVILSGALAFLTSGINAQNQQVPHKCMSHEVLQEEMQQHPELVKERQKFEESLRNYLANTTVGERKADGKRIIPVVFHVIHECGSENISKEQILDQIRILNEDYSLTNPTINQTPDAFADVAADCQIEFRLAQYDDLGNCTDGIVRIYSPKTNEANNANGVKSLSHWNYYKYLNVWVVKSIGEVQGTGTVLGYAQFPAGGLPSTDGIVLRHDCVGSIGTAANGAFGQRLGRTATHEIGHWLGLRHIWGDADCGSDGVDDTPIAFGPNYGICWDDYPYNIGSCPGGDTIHGEMFMNYMDYSDDQCMSMFTNGQKEIMDGTLAFFRSYIWSDENLEATGTSDEAIANPLACSPIARFCENRTMVCTGATVTFEDASYNSEDYTRAWEFEGGTPATSTAANPTVTYDNAGEFMVKLTVTNSLGENVYSKTDLITISPDQAEASSSFYSDAFEVEADFYNRYRVYNDDNSANKWEFIPWAGFGYGSCIRMLNYNNTPTEADAFVTPSYDMTAVNSPALLFRVSGAERGGEPNDRLLVYTSNNCGQTWILRKTWSGNDLITAGYFSNSFVPSTEGEWGELALGLAGVASQDNVRFKFEFVAGDEGSNNFYIDDIRIGEALSIADFATITSLNLAPNPANDLVKLNFNTLHPVTAQIRLLDMVGKQAISPVSASFGSGNQQYSLPISNLASGIYMIELEIEGKKVYQRLMKN
ncbi:MAG: M43 family zinc metalloprotease [Bacteroidia bacterium]